MLNTYLVKTIIKRFPAVIPHLKGKARWIAFVDNPDEYKTVAFFQQTMTRLITSVYNNDLGGEFIDIMANLISGQLRQAYEQAWTAAGLPGAFPSYLNEDLMGFVIQQFVYVDQLYRDIVDARIDKLPITPLLARVPLWANRWNEAYDRAQHLISVYNGGKEKWVLGATEKHCTTCAALNGIVAYAQEWEMLGVHPQGAPNARLECGGWRCDCRREPTEERRTEGAFSKIQGIVGG